ncbi:class I SAM-dependent methyltransferase [Kutzneria sp. CA-103260]|uniref:class I SAM-dependent methyltransferase n=1 Tax=Kutzneria sp. CA-103260 TaxID=2802641 RepID=UPI001BAE4C96|nr:class I SAM-dependent methyltransferase [Kutzneria sp. CA-103260]QUQ63137.1 transferase [Kutzneria sp. CA-103260]
MRNDFDAFYRGAPLAAGLKHNGIPWDIGQPQPAIADLDYRGDVLDVGCGLGDNAVHLESRGLTVTAVDCSPTAIAQARQRFPDSGVRFAVADAADLGEFPASFDTVLSCSLFHCLVGNDRIRHLQALHRATRRDAVLHLITFSDRLFDGLPSPFPLSEQDVRKPLSDNGWIITEFEETTLVAAGATMVALFEAADVAPRDRAELACWRVRATRE